VWLTGEFSSRQIIYTSNGEDFAEKETGGNENATGNEKHSYDDVCEIIFDSNARF